MTPEQIAAAQQACLATLQQFAQQQFAALEQLCALGLNVTKTAFEDSLALLGARTPQEAIALNLSATPKRIEQFAGDAQMLLTLAQQQRTAFDTLANSQHAQTMELIEEWSKTGVPAQTTNAMKTATETAHAAYANWAAFARQTADLMTAGLATVKPATA